MSINFSKYDWILLLIPIILWLFLRSIGYDGMAGQDSYAYTEHTQELQEWLRTGVKPKPFFWPPGYTLLGAILSLGFLPASFVLQLISSLSLGITLFYLKRISIKFVSPVSDEKSSFYFLLTWGILAPFVFRNSLATTSDMLACCLVAGALFHYFGYIHNTSFKDLLVATTFISYGVFTRYVTILIFLPLILHLIWHWSKNRFNFSHLTVLLIPLFILVLYFYFAGINTRFIKHPYLTTWSVSHLFSTHFYTPEGELNYIFPNIIYTLYPFFFPGFCMLGFLFFIRSMMNPTLHKNNFTVLLLSFAVFSIFIAGNYNQNPRHLLGIYPVVLILCFGGFDSIYSWISTKTIKKYVLCCIILIQIILCARALYPSIKRNKLERFIAADIQLYDSINTVLYSFDIDIALKHRQDKIKIQSLFDTIYVDYKPHSLVLVNESAWKKQWHGKNPMINIINLKNQHQMQLLKSYDGGWNLYRIEQ